MHADEANDLGQPQDGANAHTVSDLIVHTWLRRVCLQLRGAANTQQETHTHAREGTESFPVPLGCICSRLTAAVIVVVAREHGRARWPPDACVNIT